MDSSQASQSHVLLHIAKALESGLPAPAAMYLFESFQSVELAFTSVAEMDPWTDRFDKRAGLERRSQPHPLDGDYRQWTTRESLAFDGWDVELKASEPISEENRRHWIESGEAAERAAYVAQQQAAKEQGAKEQGGEGRD